MNFNPALRGFCGFWQSGSGNAAPEPRKRRSDLNEVVDNSLCQAVLTGMLDLQTGRKEMSTKKLQTVWHSIENKKKCNDCLLINMDPLIMKINEPVKVMVITEGPNRQQQVKNIASLGNHPTYTFLYTLFSGKAKFRGKEPNVYWTHVRKCFLGNKEHTKNEEKKALRLCRKVYLEEEIEALKPTLIVAVGCEALKFFQQSDSRLEGRLTDIVFDRKGVFGKAGFNDPYFRLVVVPHPSGRNRAWVNLPDNAYDVLRKIQSTLKRSLDEQK